MNSADSTIYFDNNATTAVDPVVLEEMLPFLGQAFGNPSSPYKLGKQALHAMEKARERVAGLLGCDSEEVLFTSCGTESTNAAIHSALAMDPDRQHVVTTRVEHSATLKTCENLAKKGRSITWLGVDDKGRLDLAEYEASITDETALVSVMWANNETGTLFDIPKMAEMARSKGVFFHTDAVQLIGKVPVNLKTLGIQLLSLSGHKLHAPKGVGALYINRKSRFHPLITGGSQENGRRGGTQNVASIVAFGKACELAQQNLESEAEKVRKLRDNFESQIFQSIEKVTINGDSENRLPNTSNLSFEGVNAEEALMLLDQQGVCCSAGSACTAGSLYPSHVLKAMGLSDEAARSSLRFSFSHLNSTKEVENAVQIIHRVVNKVRGLASH